MRPRQATLDWPVTVHGHFAKLFVEIIDMKFLQYVGQDFALYVVLEEVADP